MTKNNALEPTSQPIPSSPSAPGAPQGLFRPLAPSGAIPDPPLSSAGSSRNERTTESRKSVYAVITDRIIQALEAGTVPWRQPWRTSAPRSLATGAQYRGINRLMLELATAANGFGSCYWLTFKQALARGGNVRKGAKGYPCIFFKPVGETNDRDENEAEGESNRRVVARYYTLFNLDQCEGVAAPNAEEPPAVFSPIEACEAIVSGYEERGPQVRLGGDRAYYAPAADLVQMPLPQQFERPEAFYGTLFHEYGHSTGHPGRLARFDTTSSVAPFGSESYSREELVAEMTAAFLCADAGISPPVLSEQSAYVAGWLARLKQDSQAIVVAAGQAQKAADFILGINQEPA